MTDFEQPRWLDDAQDPGKRQLRQALDEAAPFSPSNVRQRRLWARVQDPRRATRTIRRAFLMGVLAASAVGAVALFSVDRLPPYLGKLMGTSTVAEAPTAPPAARPSLQPEVVPVPPRAPELVRTTEGQKIARQLRQGARAEVQPSSLLALDEQGKAEVRAGQVAFKVARQPAGERFSVRAAEFEVVVVGTRFLVGVTDGDVSVSVEEGVVEIWDRSNDKDRERIARLTGGQRWSGGVVTGAARLEPRPAPGLRPAAPASTSLDAGRDLAEARAARAAADPKRALAIYARLAQRGGPVAENALYEMGGIYRDQLRKPRQALAAWERYRSTYPAGLLRAEADLSIVDTLSSLGDGSRALKEALAFLDRYPRSERRGEMARVAGDLHRARGNCREAALLYDLVNASNASATDADDAAFGRVACLRALRDSEADAALRSYLRERPKGRHGAEARRLLEGGGAPPAERP
jgi:ferric-dicitrate binding protein FerR (iron transport regulator)